MSRDERPPFPYSVALNGVGMVLGVDQAGAELYTETVKSTVEVGEKHKDWTTLEGGIGVRSDDGSEAAGHSAFYINADSTDTDYAGGVGGGVDIRFGTPFLGPEVLVAAVLGSDPIRKLVKWQGKYYAACGAALIVSTQPDFSSGVSTVHTFESNIVDLLGYAGKAAPPELRIAQQYGPMYVYDGATLTADGGSQGRMITAVSSFVRSDAGVLTDYTSEVTDGNPATAADLSSLATANGYVYVGVPTPFTAIGIKMGANQNSTPAVVDAAYWNGDTAAWTALAGVTDTTQSPDGTSLGLAPPPSGGIAWTRPNANWGLLSLTAEGTPYYYVRLHWSANLDASVTLDTASGVMRQEADALGVVEERLVISSGGNTFSWTDAGGISPVWNAAVKYASNTGQVVGIVTARRAAYIVRTDGIFTVDRDGLPAQLIRFDPPAASRDAVPLGVWLDQIYLGAGGAGLTQFSPTPGGTGPLVPMGPERLNLDDAAASFPIVNAVCGDRTQFLYAALQAPDGSAHLGCWGTYSEQRDSVTGELTWIRHDAWTVLGHLRSRTIYSMATWSDAGGQPRLLMGDGAGNLLALLLPKGRSPLGDSAYRYTLIGGVLRYPTFHGDDDERPLVAYAAGIDGYALAAGQTATVQTVTPGTSTVVGSAAWAANPASTDEAKAFNAAFSGRGVDVRLVLSTNDATKTPVLRRVSLMYQGAIKAAQRVIECTVLADDDGCR
jgi:hypothetical protein